MSGSRIPPHAADPMEVRSGASLLRGILVATAAAAAASLLTLPLLPFLPHTRLVLFYAAVMFAAWYGGTVAGLTAIVLSAVAAELFVMGGDPLRPDVAMVVRLALFGATAYAGTALLSVVRRSQRESQQRASETRLLAGQLEEQAVTLQSQIAESQSLTLEFQRLNDELVAKQEAVERVARRTRRLHKTTAALLRTITPHQVVRVMMEDGLGTVDADLGVVAVLSADERTVRISGAKGYPVEHLERAKLLPLDSPVPISVAIRTSEPVWIARSGGSDPLPSAVAASRAANDEGIPVTRATDAAWAVLPLVGRDRTIGALALGFSRDGDFSEDEKTLFLLLAQECAQALERARLYEAERTARVKAEFAERQIAFLAEASNRLAESLDFGRTLASVARLAVPELADWCVIHLTDEQRGLRLLVAEHTDPARADVLREIGRRFPPRPSAPTGPGRVYQTGESELIRTVTTEVLEGLAWDNEHLRLLRTLAPRSEICVPMTSHERVLGTITLAVAESGRHYTQADLALAEEVAARAAQAIENARLYQHTKTASQAKSDFLAVMSHELRTPLNAILGYADLVLLGVPGTVPDKTRDYVERVRGAAQSLLRLVEEVLSFARLEAGKEDVQLGNVDVNAAVREAVALIEADAADKGIAVTLDLSERPVELQTDGFKLRQVLDNLLSNAVKFTTTGTIGVAVSTDAKGACIRVQDTGIGIPPEHLEHVFDPFWQVEQTSTRRYGGAGLGLGVARELAKLLGGELRVESEQGAGSTFTLRLPNRWAGSALSAP